MIDNNNVLRKTDEELQRYADRILDDFNLMISRGVHVIYPTSLVVRELVLRELERRQKKEGDGDA